MFLNVVTKEIKKYTKPKQQNILQKQKTKKQTKQKTKKMHNYVPDHSVPDFVCFVFFVLFFCVFFGFI